MFTMTTTSIHQLHNYSDDHHHDDYKRNKNPNQMTRRRRIRRRMTAIKSSFTHHQEHQPEHHKNHEKPFAAAGGWTLNLNPRRISLCIIAWSISVLLLNNISHADGNRLPLIGGGGGGPGSRNGPGHTLSFTQEPNSILVAIDGKRTSFKCEVKPAHAEIKWLINGRELADNSIPGLKVQRNKVIVALQSNQNVNLSALHSSTIQCIGQLGDHAIVSQPAKLLIASISDFPDEPHHNHQQSINEQTVTVIAGNTAVIRCTAPHSVPQAVTEFDHNGVIIDKSTDRLHLMPSGDLHIQRVTQGDNGQYRCIAFNPYLPERRTAKHAIILKVRKMNKRQRQRPNHNLQQLMDMKFVVQPKQFVSVVMGSNYTLECVAHAWPPPNITWAKVDGTSSRISSKHRQIGSNLYLIDVRKGDEGTYVCTATSETGRSISAHSVLEVQEIPQITIEPEDKVANVGESVSLDCQVEGTPKPIISWVHNGKRLDDEEAKRRGMEMLIQDKLSKLVINRANPRLNTGFFQCFATNELGSIYSTAEVSIIGSSSSSSTSSSAGDGLKDEEEGNDHEPLDSNSHDYEDDDELPPVSRRPTNNNNNGAGGGGGGGGRRNKNRNVKMEPPGTPDVSRLSEEAVLVRWNVRPNDGLPILFFKVQYQEVPGRRDQWHTVDEEIPAHVFSYAVNGLKTGAKYKFRIAAVYSNNDNKVSQASKKFHLLKEPPIEKPYHSPIIVEVAPINPTSLRVSWDYIKMDDAPVDGYIISYRTTTSAGDYTRVTAVGIQTRTQVLTHLQADTSYEIKIQCFNIAGTSDYSNMVVQKTLPKSEGSSEKGKGKDRDGSGSGNQDGGGPPITNLIPTVSADDDSTLYVVIIGVAAALLLVAIVCIVLCCMRSKQPQARRAPSVSKLPKEKHPKSVIKSHHHHNLSHLSQHHPFASSHHTLTSFSNLHSKSNGNLSLSHANSARFLTNGFLTHGTLRNGNAMHNNHDGAHNNSIMNPSDDDTSLPENTSFNNMIPHAYSTREVSRGSFSASSSSASGHNRYNQQQQQQQQHHAATNGAATANNIMTMDSVNMNTLERRRMRRVADEVHPLHHHQSNGRLHSTNAAAASMNGSLHRLNGTLERRKRSRNDLTSLDSNTLSSNHHHQQQDSRSRTPVSNGGLLNGGGHHNHHHSSSIHSRDELDPMLSTSIINRTTHNNIIGGAGNHHQLNQSHLRCNGNGSLGNGTLLATSSNGKAIMQSSC